MKSNLKAKVENCIHCKGTGKVRINNKVIECLECRAERQKLKNYNKANIPQRFHDFNLEELQSDIKLELDSLDGNIKEVNFEDLLNEYTNNIDVFYEKGNGLYAYGPNGSGKSTLASLIGKNILDNSNYSVKWFNHLSLIKDIQRTWNTDYQSQFKQQLIAVFKDIDFLIIDDFLYQEHDSDWSRELISEMLKIRDDNNLPVIFTSNYNIDQIAKIIDGNKLTQNSQSIISKILGVIDSVVEFDSQNFRLNNVGENSVLFNNK